MPSLIWASFFDAEPLDAFERAVGDGGGEFVDGRHALLLPDGLDRLGPHAGDVEHGDDALGHAGEQLVVVDASPLGQPIGDDLAARLANALDGLDRLDAALVE